MSQYPGSAPSQYPPPSSGQYAPPSSAPYHSYQSPQQQGGYAPGQAPPSYATAAYAQPAQPVVVASAPPPLVMTMSAPYLPPHPCMMTCPNCRQQITTRVVQRDGLLVWASCAALAFVGCIFGCCLIPFCVPEMKDTDHFCPNCNVLLGSRSTL